MKTNTLLILVIAATLLGCNNTSNNLAPSSASSNNNSGPCLQSSLITTTIPAFSGPDSVYKQSMWYPYYAIFSEGNTSYTAVHNYTSNGNFFLSNSPQSNCPGSYMNEYLTLTNYMGNWASNIFYTVHLGIIGPGDSSLWRTAFSKGRYGVHFNNNFTKIADRWGYA